MTEEEKLKAIAELQNEQDVLNFKSNLSRARSIVVGTAFGGATEVSMRADGGRSLWCILQPVEVIELVHQLAANAGCHIQIKPRDDFASWREWRIPEAEKKHLNGHVPFVNDMAIFKNIGMVGFDQEQAERHIAEWLKQTEHPAEKIARKNNQLKVKGEKNDSALATEKTVNKRSLKRTTKTS